MSKLSYELIVYILEYIPDIDTRREFGIYRPISYEKYVPISYCIRTPYHVESFYRFYFIRFSLPNRCNLSTRDEQNVDCDYMDLEYWQGANQISWDVSIYRLKEKTEYYTGHERDQVYYKGNFDNYYWQTISFGYDPD
jgi:hypothetical protein